MRSSTPSRAPWAVFAGVLTVVALVTPAWVAWHRDSRGPISIDLIDAFPGAEKRTTMATLQDAFLVQETAIDGITLPSILALPFSRILWDVERVPPGGTLTLSLAMRPDTWDTPGDGAVFRVGVSDGRVYTELHRQVVQPQAVEADRRWFHLEFDLARWAGRPVRIVFNTEPGASGNAVGDAAVWGVPRVQGR